MSSATRPPRNGCSPPPRHCNPPPPPPLRRMAPAGEPLDPETIAAWQEATGLEPADGYGQTETGQVTANLAGEAVRRGSMGRPLPGMDVRFEGEWWPTGDLVTEDDEGFLFFDGRNDDIISSSGYRIGPTEVEVALLSHPAVADAAAVAAPDPERGSVVRAIVVLRDREPSEELVTELRDIGWAQKPPSKPPRTSDFAAGL